MAYRKNMEPVRIQRREAIGMEPLIRMYIREMKLSTELNRQRIYAAWSKVSGAAPYTLKRFVKKGTLYCVISSSMVRNRLFFQKEVLVELINEELRRDELFTADDKVENFIKSIVLK